MNKMTIKLGKITLFLIASGAICGGISMLIIIYVKNKGNMDNIIGWLAVWLILLSILMFLAFLISFIVYRIKLRTNASQQL